jgi:hypothetical protein
MLKHLTRNRDALCSDYKDQKKNTLASCAKQLNRQKICFSSAAMVNAFSYCEQETS